MKPLSSKQRQTLEAIAAGCRSGLPPTLRELGAALEVRSTNAINDRIAILERRKLVERSPMISRGLVVTAAGWLELQEPVPVVTGCCPTCKRPL